MERRLLRYIATPAMIATFFFGLMLFRYVDLAQAGWMHSKLLLVFVLAGFHGMMARWRKDFAADQNRRSAKFYRIANEVPTVALLLIVFLVVLKPF
jgi:putative membrane protein